MAETDIHRDLMMDFIWMLKQHFRDRNDVYVSGNLLMYYEKGEPRKSISPDVFVVFGIEKKERLNYLTWEEGHTPDFVLEIASRRTYRKDIGPKKELYASVLGVKEYFIYDPLGQIVPSFIGYSLIEGIYRELEFAGGRLPSEILDLELGEQDGRLGLYNPNTAQWLNPPTEQIEKEITARKEAETELAEALLEIERLRGNRDN
jgi:Uma2 family endonuclease